MTREEALARISADRDFMLVPKEIAKYARVTARTVCNWFAGGYLHGEKYGPKLWRISVHQLQLDKPNLPDSFWIDVAIDHYTHPKLGDSVKLTLEGR